MHIQVRLWSSSTADTEAPRVGEPFYDPVTNRFGLWGSDNRMHWQAAASPEVISPDVGQRIAGIVEGGEVNGVGLSLSTPGEVRVVDVRTGAVFARFTSSGSYFTSAQVTGVQRLGVVNHVCNAGLQVMRSFGAPAEGAPWRATGGPTETSRLIAPNWQLWCAPNRTGQLEATFSDDVPFSGPRRSVRVAPVLTTSHGGLRVFAHDALQFAGKRVAVSAWLKGPVGKLAQQRVLTSANLHRTTDYVATGNWDRVSTVLTMPARSVLLSANFVAFDLLYNPSGGSNVVWFAAAPQISISESPVDFDIRPLELEEAMASRVYTERTSRFRRGESRDLSWNLIEGHTESFVSSDPQVPVVQTFLGNQGVTLSIAQEATTYQQPITVRTAGYRLPFLQESLGT